MRVQLDGRKAESRRALHRLIAQRLGFPAWYGANLDALHDCLTDLPEPVELTITHADALGDTLGAYAAAFRRVLEDSAEENPNLTVFWEETSSAAEKRKSGAS